jgi:hypothetical protein
MATAAREIRRRQISARSPRGPLRLHLTGLFVLQTLWIRAGISSSVQTRSRVHRGRAQVYFFNVMIDHGVQVHDDHKISQQHVNVKE